MSTLSDTSYTARFVNGWQVFDRLAEIDRETRLLLPADLPIFDTSEGEKVSLQTRHLLQQEVEIRRRRCFYIESSTDTELEGYDELVRQLKVNVLGYREENPASPGPERFDRLDVPLTGIIWISLAHSFMILRPQASGSNGYDLILAIEFEIREKPECR